MFNRLAHGGYGESGTSILTGARVLDLCCGTGALGLEALSRGAEHATLVDADPRILSLVRSNAEALGVADVCTVHPAKLPAGLPRGPFDLVFLDPPYAEKLSEPILEALALTDVLRPGGLISVETSAKERLAIPSTFTLLHEQRYGAAKLWLLQAGESS